MSDPTPLSLTVPPEGAASAMQAPDWVEASATAIASTPTPSASADSAAVPAEATATAHVLADAQADAQVDTQADAVTAEASERDAHAEAGPPSQPFVDEAAAPEQAMEPGAEAAARAATVETAPSLSPQQTAARLAELFPALFGPQVRPIKLRIQADIQQRAPGVFQRRSLSWFLSRHTTTNAYIKSLLHESTRFDLDGQPVGEISAEHKQAAHEELARRRDVAIAKRQQARQGPRAPGDRSAQTASRGAPQGAPQAPSHPGARSDGTPGNQAGEITSPAPPSVPGNPDPELAADSGMLNPAQHRPPSQASWPHGGRGLASDPRTRRSLQQHQRTTDRPTGGRADRPSSGPSQGTRPNPNPNPNSRPPERQLAIERQRAMERTHPGPGGPSGHRPPQAWQQPVLRPPAQTRRDGAGEGAAGPSDAAQRERWNLLRAWEGSALSKGNFCALKRLTEADFDAQLALAREERDKRRGG